MKNWPLISVLVPAYNHERYVAGCVHSILAQDWPRMELLVVDDGSQDGTWAVLQSLRSKCESQLERVEFIRQENTGICGALNRLSKMAKGEFVAIIASDDEYLPGAFSAMMPEFENPDVGIVVGQNEIMDGEGRRCFWNRRLQNVYREHEAVYRTWNQYLAALTGVAENGPDYGSYRKLGECNHVVNGYLIRWSHWDRILPYRQEAPTEDLWFHMQFSKFAKYRAVSTSTFRYRWHDGNFSRQSLRAIRSRYLTMRWEQGNVRKYDFPALVKTLPEDYQRPVLIDYAKKLQIWAKGGAA